MSNHPMPDAQVEYGFETIRIGGVDRVASNFVLSPDDIELIREGRLCIRCLSRQSQPFPEVCEFEGKTAEVEWRCNFPIREKQLAWFQEQFLGEAPQAPDPYSQLDDERDYWRPTKTGIVVPRDAAS